MSAGQIFLDKVVLLSSAVADADNQVMMHGRKLEVLSAIENLIPALTKTEISGAQKKVEDLCVRILFQNCPAILVRLIVAVLQGLYTRGSSAGMHACVAFLLQVSAAHRLKDAQLDRPFPNEEENSNKVFTAHERAVCLSVAVGVVVARGPSASYFVPNIVGCVSKHLRLVEATARESAVRNLDAVIEKVGIPGSVGDVWKLFLHRAVFTDKSPQVRIAAARCTAGLIRRWAKNLNLDTIQGVALKIVLSSDSGFTGKLLIEARDAHLEVIIELLRSSIGTGVCGQAIGGPISGSIKSVVSDFSSALAWLLGLMRKYKTHPHAIAALTTAAVRLASCEEEIFLLAAVVVRDIAELSVSVASMALHRLLRDSSVLRFATEILVPVLVASTNSSPTSLCVALSGLAESMALAGGSILALDEVPQKLVVLLLSSSTSVATGAAFALRAFAHVCPAQSFSIVNILLNHLRVQVAELLGSAITDTHQMISILHFSIALSSVMCECGAALPRDVAGAVLSTASSLIEDAEDSVVGWQKKSAGFILLVPLLGEGVMPPSQLASQLVVLLGLWKRVLGKQAKDCVVSDTSKDTSLNLLIEQLQAVLCGVRSLRIFLTAHFAQEAISADTSKMILLLLNNVWQIVQQVTLAGVQSIVEAIRAELFEALLATDNTDSLTKPLIAFLAVEVGVGTRKISQSALVEELTGLSSQVQGTLIDLADPVLVHAPEYALAAAVEASLPLVSESIRDYFSSSLSAGSLEEYFQQFPNARGSPYCPQIPYLPSLDALAPLASQMSHPGGDAKKFSLQLLAKLLARADPATFDACINVCYAAVKANPESSSADFESAPSKDEEELQLATPNITPLLVMFGLIFREARIAKTSVSESGVTAVLSLAASRLGALHPLTRRVSAWVISEIFFSQPQNLAVADSIHRCVAESAKSGTMRTRAATATLLSFLIKPTTVSLFVPTLFKLARELTHPLRACSLLAIQIACASAQTSMAPYVREVLKITMAHAVADVFPSPLSWVLLSNIVSGILAVSSLSQSEFARCDLLWGELCQTGTREVAIERFCISYASRADPTSKRHGKYVNEQITKSLASSASVCRMAIIGFTEMTEQGLALSVADCAELYDTLFVVSDVDPRLRSQVNLLLKVLLRIHGAKALPVILNSLRAHVAASEREDEDEEYRNAADEDDYGSDHEAAAKSSSNAQNSTKLGSSTTSKRTLSNSTRSLALKCLKRILKTRAPCISSLDQLVHVAVSAVATEGSQELNVQGIKLLLLIMQVFASEIDPRTLKPEQGSGGNFASDQSEHNLPLLLQYETQILSAVRRGVRVNSDASPLVQKYSLFALQTMVAKRLSSSVDKLLELLVQPLVAIEPASMPWSSYFALREAGTTVLGQSNERDISLLLHIRLQVIVALMESSSSVFVLPAARRFIHYFLIRTLIDAGILLGSCVGSKSGSHLFSVLPADLPTLDTKNILFPLVVHGVALSVKLGFGALECPSDCPSPELFDLKAIFVALAVQLPPSALTQAALLVAFELGYPAILDLFAQPLDPATDLGFLQMADVLVKEHPTFACTRVDLVWNLVKNCFLDLAVWGDVVVWLVQHGGLFSEEFVSNVYAVLLINPSTGLGIWRDCLAAIPDSSLLLPLLDDVANLLQNGDVKLVVALVVTLLLRLELSDQYDLQPLMDGLMHAFHRDDQAVIQCVGKLLTMPSLVPRLCLPLVVEIVTFNAGFGLLSQLALDKNSSQHKKFVQFVLQVALTQPDSDDLAKAVIACMHPAEVFRESISDLGTEDKATVETMVRKHLPRHSVREVKVSDEVAPESDNSSVAAAPQIQLKLKFGK